MRFRDRRAAGRRLAEALRDLEAADPLVLALPRGGVPVAYEIAHALDAPLEVLVVRKLGAPARPELGIGAVAEGGTTLVDEELCQRLHLSSEEVDEIAHAERLEVARRVRRYRNEELAPLAGRTVLLVDDGLATGVTLRAAVREVKLRGAARILAAVPVASAEAAERVRHEVEALHALVITRHMVAVGAWYEDFRQVDDHEVVALLSSEEEPTWPGDEVGVVDPVISVSVGEDELEGTLALPAAQSGLVVFAGGTGSARFSPRNLSLAEVLQEAGFGTLLIDLLTVRETARELRSATRRFDIPLLGTRLSAILDWLAHSTLTAHLRVGVFGASTGAAAALTAAAERPDQVAAVVSRGGRPDLAEPILADVRAPTRLIVGGADEVVLALNRNALTQLGGEKDLVIVPDATHLFEEEGALARVGELATEWFARHLVDHHAGRALHQ